jgi:hypothetical protein
LLEAAFAWAASFFDQTIMAPGFPAPHERGRLELHESGTYAKLLRYREDLLGD